MRALLVGLLLLSGAAWAQPLQAAFESWRAQDGLRPAQVGFLLVRLRDSAVLASHDADRLFVPASSAKVMTAQAVLAADPDRVLSTRLGYRGDDLVLWGAGDPELTTAHLAQLAAQVAAGPRSGFRRLLVGSPYRDPQAPLGAGWAWDDATEDYSAEISGLTVERGTVSLTVRPGAPGQPPGVEGAPLEVTATTVSGPGTGWGLSRLPGRAGTLLWGEVPAGPPLTVKLAVVDPDLLAGQRLLVLLAQRGVSVEGLERCPESAPGEVSWIAEHRSRPLREILREALARSDNLAMELLIRLATGRRAPPAPPPARLVDGSGLSRYNLLTPRHLVEALAANAQVRELLPLAGVEGTLRQRLRGGLAYRQVRAKTGTLSSVSALAGTLFPDDPEQACVFALLTNGHPGPGRELKQAEDALVEELVARIGYPYLPR